MLEKTDYSVGFLLLLNGINFIVFIAFIVEFSHIAKIKRSYCKKCGTKYDYEEDIAWEVTSSSANSTSTYSNIHFECSCHNCGAVKDLYKKVQTGHYNENNGTTSNYNVSSIAKNMFIK